MGMRFEIATFNGSESTWGPGDHGMEGKALALSAVAPVGQVVDKRTPHARSG